MDANGNMVTVRMGRDVSFEDPFVCHLWGCRGGEDIQGQAQHTTVAQRRDGPGVRGGGGVGRWHLRQHGARHHHPYLGIILPEDPPKVVVTYRLSQRYGPSRLTVDWLLLVMVQDRSRGCSKQLRRIARNGKIGAVPLATSSLAPRAAAVVHPRLC